MPGLVVTNAAHASAGPDGLRAEAGRSSSGLSFSETTIIATDGQRTALVLTPTRHVVLGLEMLNKPVRTTLSETDRIIVAEARTRARTRLVIFRGRDDAGQGSWRLQPMLDQRDRIRVCDRVLRETVPVYRELVRLGLCLHVHVDWEPEEAAAYRDAGAALATELSASTDEHARLDSWVLRNLSFFFSLSFDRVVSNVLPNKLALMDKRTERIRSMALALPPRCDQAKPDSDPENQGPGSDE